MPAIDLTQITVGGPCKITDVSQVIYTDGDVKLTPEPKYRGVGSSVAGENDDTLVDLVWKISYVPKAIWSSGYRGVVIPSVMYNWSTSGGRLIGNSNRAVTILGSDGEQYAMTRCRTTKPAPVYVGLGKPLYGGVEMTAFIGQGKALTDADAFYSQTTGVAWDQSDYPTGNQEAIGNMAWGAVSGWTQVFAAEGFQLDHELKMSPVYLGNITVDQRITGYRAKLGFTPEQPTSAQLLAALALQGTSAGIGARRSAVANDAVVTASGLSITVVSAAVDRGDFMFSNKVNRHGEFGMITALSTPGNRLTFS